MIIITNLLETIGETSLIALPSFSAELSGVTPLVKAGFMNPSGSVKGHAAKTMVLDGITWGLLASDKITIDTTSGSTGTAYVTVGVALEYHTRLYPPQNTSPERKKTTRRYGVTVVETDPLEGSDGAYLEVQAQVTAHPERYFHPDQYNNPVSLQTYFATTGKEIWEQNGKQATRFVAGMGMSSNFVDTTRRLKLEDLWARTLTAQPASPFHGIEGTKYMGNSIKPSILDETLFDDMVSVTAEEAYASAWRFARRDGIFVDISSGANVIAVVRLACMLPASSVVITLLCGVGSHYLTDPLRNEARD